MLSTYLEKILEKNKLDYSVYSIAGGKMYTFPLPDNNIKCSLTCKRSLNYYDLNFTVICSNILSHPKFINVKTDMQIVITEVFSTFQDLLEQAGVFNQKNADFLDKLLSSYFS